ncbi:MAG: cytochrome c oxidase subunit II [Chloroflexota bacterium]|nr:cytochrome c oxidase subunit II [Chloroflexota bacterium]
MERTVARYPLRTLLGRGAPLLLIGLLTGCLLPPEPATEVGKDVFNLYVIVLILAGIVFIGVEGFILYAVFRYRRQPGDDVLPQQLHGNTTVEIIWTLIPTVIVLLLFGFSMATLGDVEARSETPGVTVQVDGFQWNWTFRYEDGTVVNPEGGEPPVLAVPVGEPVRLVLNSLDVNHAFYVPQFLIKRDLINLGENGRDNELEFTITEAGTYAGQCAEFCGTDHADMTFVVEAMDRAAFDEHMAALASGEPPPGPADGECGTTVQLAAVESIQFDTGSLEVPAGEDFCIEFTNNDAAPHDVGIVETGFDGEDVPPGESTTYVIPAMDAGDYTFYCTLHPTQMTGDLSVTE